MTDPNHPVHGGLAEQEPADRPAAGPEPRAAGPESPRSEPESPASDGGAAPPVGTTPAHRFRLIIEAAWAVGAALVSTVTAAFALRISPSDLGQRWTIGTDDQILHYTLFTSATQSFPFALNENLGFPRGLNAFFSAQFDVSSALVASLLGLVIDDGFVLLNVFYLLTFAGVAVTGYLFFRALRVRPWVAAFVAVVFSLAPYHFLRVSAGHAFLANYWAIPLIGILVLVAAGERTDPFRAWAARAASRRGAALRRGLPIVGLACAIASTGGYYYVFGVIVVGGVWLLASLGHLLRGRPVRELTWATVAVVALVVVVGIELIVLSLGFGERYAPYFQDRGYNESELYAGRLLPLLLPWAGSALPGIGRLGILYQDLSPTSPTTEPPGLPAVASLGLAVLVVSLGLLAVAGGSGLRATAVGRLVGDDRVRVLATATFWVLLFYTITGLGMAVALVLGPTIRAWARLSIVLALLALGLVALVLDRITTRYGLRWIVAGVLAVVVLFDQVLGVARAVPIGPTDDAEMSSFVAQADALLPDGCGVVELPLKSFPDSGRIGALSDYDEALPFLYTTDGDLRWSYGSIKGTYGWDYWNSATDPAGFAEAVRSSGACAVYLDTAGYTEAEGAWRPFVQAVTDGRIEPIVTSSSGRYLLFPVAG